MSTEPSARPMRSTYDVILDTLCGINSALARDPNALTTTRDGNVAPEAAYIELVREVLDLRKRK